MGRFSKEWVIREQKHIFITTYSVEIFNGLLSQRHLATGHQFIHHNVQITMV